MAKDDDPQLNAARYVVDRLAKERGEDPTTPAQRSTSPTAHDRAMYVETAIQQAIRRGEFDDLPGAGKPLTGLGSVHDPDWWIRRKIQRENLTGLGPPALTLRVEHRELESRLDALTREDDVRAYLEDFNRRVIEARRQLLGGPPVVTPTRDVEHELEAWRARRSSSAREADPRRSSSAREADAYRDPTPPEPAPRPWYGRVRRGSTR